MKLTKTKDIITLLLIGVNLLCWIILFTQFNSLPTIILIVFGALTLAFQGSLQHELIHNHPFQSQKLNDVIGNFTGNPFLPYALYKESHIRHHECSHYAHPEFDPETFLVTEKTYRNFNWITKKIFDVNQCVVGRMILGPWISGFWTVGKEIRRVLNKDYEGIKSYVPHFIIWSGLLTLMYFFQISIIEYFLFVVYPGSALILLRSYLEHRMSDVQAEQTCIVESGPFFSLLFLNNNLHLVHHSHMDAPWYDLPKLYKSQKDRWLNANGSYTYSSYWQIIFRHALRPKSKAWVKI